MKVDIIKAQAKDAGRLADVFNASFYSDYLKYGECPGYNKTEDSILESMKQHTVFKIMADGIIVGAVSVKTEQAHHYFLSALCVIPDYANQGIGQKAMHLLDDEFPDAVHWALETPTDKKENHYFYQKFGYQATNQYMVKNVPISYLERQLPK